MKEEEFDPSTSEEFLKNLDKVFEEAAAEEESEAVDVSLDSDFQWIDIGEEAKPQETVTPEVTEEDNNPAEEEGGQKEGEEAEAEPLKEQSAPTSSDMEELPPVSLPPSKEPEENESEEEEILRGINSALAEQIATQFGGADQKKEENAKQTAKKGRRIPIWLRASAITLASLLVVLGLLFGTKPGRRVLYGIAANIVHSGITQGSEENNEIYEGPLEGDDYINPDQVKKDENGNSLDDNGNVVEVPSEEDDKSLIRSEDYCYNVLLMGEEAIRSYGARGRTDLIMIATINSKEKKIKLTSLMRDMYVQIPGYEDNKLNAAYAKGGAKLLMDTVELNLKIKLDGYVLVGFDGFEQIIDRLGGVEISLTAEEAQYLQTHNYISNPANRNVVAGTQIMNGNQVLGYCRVRYVPTAEGLQNDFGRTARQRMVLNQLFQKYKTKNFIELAAILYDCLPLVTSDISKEDMTDLLELVLEERILTLETKQIPVKGSYSDTYIGDMSVLAVNWAENTKALQEFIFGADAEE